MNTLGELCRYSVSGVLTTDRDGDRGCGPIFWTNRQIIRRGLQNESITLVTEDEDPEAWELMRQAIAEVPGSDPSRLSVVAVGSVPTHPDDAQVIYGVSLRHEGHA